MVLTKGYRVWRKLKPRSALLECRDVTDGSLLFELDNVAALCEYVRSWQTIQTPPPPSLSHTCSSYGDRPCSLKVHRERASVRVSWGSASQRGDYEPQLHGVCHRVSVCRQGAGRRSVPHHPSHPPSPELQSQPRTSSRSRQAVGVRTVLLFPPQHRAVWPPVARANTWRWKRTEALLLVSFFLGGHWRLLTGIVIWSHPPQEQSNVPISGAIRHRLQEMAVSHHMRRSPDTHGVRRGQTGEGLPLLEAELRKSWHQVSPRCAPASTGLQFCTKHTGFTLEGSMMKDMWPTLLRLS